MQKMLGVWVDQDHARITSVVDGRLTSRVVFSGVPPKHRATGGERGALGFRHESVSAARHIEGHRRNDLARYYKRIVSEVGDAQHVVIAGPGLAKKAVARLFVERPTALQPDVDVVTTSSRMTEAQIDAMFAGRFGHGARRQALRFPSQPLA
jgi:hypothetical protein